MTRTCTPRSQGVQICLAVVLDDLSWTVWFHNGFSDQAGSLGIHATSIPASELSRYGLPDIIPGTGFLDGSN